MIANIVTQTTATSTGPLGAGLDTSGIVGEYLVRLRIQSLTAGSKCTLRLEGSTNSFTTTQPLAVVEIVGQVDPKAEINFSWRKYELAPSSLIGVASSVLRPNVLTLTGSSPALQVDAWIEY
jgi:hypothetical protein